MRAIPLPLPRPLEGLLWLSLVLLTVGLLTTPYYAVSWLPAAALIALLVIGRCPHVAYYAIIFLIPFGAYRALPGPWGEIRLHWVLAFLLAGYLFLRYVVTRNPLQKLRCNLWPWLFAYLAVGAFSACLSPFRETALSELFFQSIGYVYIALTLAFLTEKGFRSAAPAVIRWSVSLGSLLAILGYYFNIELFAVVEPGVEAKRALGGTTWANNLAMTIYIAMPFLVHAAIHARTVPGRVVALLLVLLNLAAMQTTLSRLGLLMLIFVAVALFVEYAPHLRARRVAPLYLVLVPFLIALPFVISDVYRRRLGRTTSTADVSVARRITYLQVAREAFKEDPVFGSGPGTFRDIYGGTNYALSFARPGATLRRYAHNSYVEVLVGTGLVGLVLFLAVLLRGLRNFTLARAAFERAQDWESVALVGVYRIAFLCFFLHFLAASALDNKYFLFLLPASQVAMRLASQRKKQPGGEAGSETSPAEA
ncbi:MAG TPA: O-antigen ligase family protein [Sumerlaeia bacterium]|nr:O-antigen ligase family protein [Sumerlaeia bacterium]